MVERRRSFADVATSARAESPSRPSGAAVKFRTAMGSNALYKTVRFPEPVGPTTMNGTGAAGSFWTTLNLLVDSDWRRTSKEALDDVEDWLNTFVKKRTQRSDTENSIVSDDVELEDGEHVPILTLPKLECSFSHPKVRSRLERLMGSNLVRLTDRQYMLRLHDRILEDYMNSMNKRIAAREAMEREREKTLVLTGKIPLEDAPPAMANHPVLIINAYCEKLIAERRAKIKIPKVYIPLYLYLDDTPDPPPGLTIVEGHVFHNEEDPFYTPPSVHLSFSDEDDVKHGYMFAPDDYDAKKKYESPEIKELAQVETVEEMYNLAESIIGPLKTLQTTSKEERRDE